MPYNLTTRLVGAQAIAVSDTVAQLVLGARATAFDPLYGEGDFIYLAGVASTAIGDVVAFDQRLGTTTRAVAATRGPCAVAMSANIAGQFGWYQLTGAAVVKSSVLVAQAPAYATATAGTIDDTVLAGSKIDGMVTKTADGTPAATFSVCQISFPCMNGNG